jgi:hypothetical protein
MKRLSLILAFICGMTATSKLQAEVSKSLPETIDPDRHYLFYLHGQIVEGSDGTPVHPNLGTYNYPKIVEALEKEGFWVISEIRRKNSNPGTYAGLISFYVDQLKEAGVPSSNITVVGGSKGGIIACYVSNKQQDPDINYVILAGFFYSMKADPKMLVSGRVLAIHDSADQSNINPKYFLKKSKAVTQEKIVITRRGWGHALIFEPRREWISELVKWSGIKEEKKAKD